MKRFLSVLLFMLLFSFTSFATPSTSAPLSELKLSDKFFTINQIDLPIYNVFSTDYIALYNLKDAGYQVGFNDYTNTIVVSKPSRLISVEDLGNINKDIVPSLENAFYTLFDGSVYIEGLHTHGIIANNHVLVPIASLAAIGKIHQIESGYFLTFAPDSLITADYSTVRNFSSEPTFVSVVDIFWNKGWITRTTSYQVEPYDSIQRNVNQNNTDLYLSSVVTIIKNDTLDISHFNLLGQLNTNLFELNDRANSIGDLSNLGDSISLANALSIEDTVRQMNPSSKTPFFIWTDIKTQRTYIFEKRNDQWHLIKHFLCSTGRSSSPTPTGTYELTKKVPYFGVQKGYRCKNAFGFIGTTYLYHSTMFDVTGSYELKGKGTLGKQASAGCIRLSPENSLWLYNNMLSGTKVYIQ